MANILAVVLAFSSTALAQPHREDLERALWNSLRQQLTGPDADAYFKSSLKDATLPTLSGRFVARDPNNGQTLALSMGASQDPEVVLVLKNEAVKYAGQLQPGIKAAFSAVAARSFNREPFYVVFEVENVQEPLAALGALASSWYFGDDVGSVENARYRNGAVEFELPQEWSVLGTRPAADDGDLTVLQSDQIGAIAAVWIRRDTIPIANIPAELHKLLGQALNQRSDLEHYAIRPASVQTTWIGGRQALQAQADYDDGTQKMSEALTCIVTEHTRAIFFGRSAPEGLSELQSSLDRLIYSTIVP